MGRHAPTKFRVAAPFPLKRHPSPWRAQVVQVCALGYSPTAGLGRMQTAKPRVRNQRWHFPGLNHLTEGRDSSGGEHSVRNEVKSTLPCSLNVYEIIPPDSGKISLQGTKVIFSHLLEQQRWRST